MNAGRPAWLLGILFSARIAAQAEMLPVRTYTTLDGLPSDGVTRIRQDSHGFLWMTAGDGISRFDGRSFRNYSTDDGLPDRRVNDFLEARDGVYWIATDAGLARFDPAAARRARGAAEEAERGERSRVSGPFVSVATGEGGRPIAVNALLEGENGVIWCGTAEGLYRLESTPAGVARLGLVDLGLEDRIVTTLLKDRKGFLWIGTRSGVLCRLAPDGRTERYSERNGLRRRLLTSLLQTADGHIWLGTQSGLCELVDDPDPARPLVARIYLEADGLASSWIMALFQGRDGRIWVATSLGLCLLTPSEGGSPGFKAYGARNGLCDQDTNHVSEDRDGNLWIASRCGAARVARNGFIGYGADDGLTTLSMNALFEDREGGLIAVEHGGNSGGAAYGRRLHRFDGSRFTGVTPALPARIKYHGWGQGQTVLQRRNGEWWIPTSDGVYRFPAGGSLDALERERPRRLPGIGDAISPEVFRLYEDSRGDVWIVTTTPRRALWLWDSVRSSVRDLTPETRAPAGIDFSAFLEDRAGNLWIGMADGGLLRYSAGRFERFTAADGIPKGWILWLHQDLAGRLWIASTRGGLGRVDDPAAARPSVRTYSGAAGMSSDVRCVTSDERGRIYAGTPRGVERLDPATGRVKRYTVADGLPRSVIEVALRDRRGALWFGSTFGLSRFVPGRDDSSSPPAVVITGLRIAGVGQPVSELGETELPKLTLASDQSNISMDVVGLGASLGEELLFQYRLEGAEREWSAPTPDRTIKFARLAPGRYRFQARAQSADGLVSPAPATFAFTVAAAFWRTWWFWAAIAVTVGAAATVLYRYRVSRLLEMAAMRARIAMDLHDDIGANLTRISILSDVARQQSGDLDPDSDLPLGSISRIAKESVSSMGDIVWAIDPRRDSLRDLVRRMRRHAEEVLAHETVLTIDVPDAERDLKLGAGTRRNVLLIFKEAINNTARHARASRVEIEFRVDGGRLYLHISDDGAGFDTAKASEGQGLVSMRRRAAALGGDLKVASIPHRGTDVTMTVLVSGN